MLIPIIVSVMVFVAIVAVGIVVGNRQATRAKDRSLALVSGYASHDVHAAIAEVEQRDSPIRAMVLLLGERLVSAKTREKLARNVAYTGQTSPEAVTGVIMRKVLFGIIGAVLGLLLALSWGGIAWLALPGFALAGFYIPDLLIYNTGLKRDQEMALRLPDALDMLNLCVESGLSFQAALAQVAANQRGPVADEFALALQEMQYGRSRGQALAALAGRTRQEDIQRFVSAMLQVDKLGVPVATVLREQAREMRAKRYARAREQAQKVPVKILMPLMLCFLPALFIIILGPAVNSIVRVFSGLN